MEHMSEDASWRVSHDKTEEHAIRDPVDYYLAHWSRDRYNENAGKVDESSLQIDELDPNQLNLLIDDEPEFQHNLC